MAPGKPVIGLFDKESEIGRAIKDAGCGFIAKENESPQDLKKKIIQAIKTGESKRMGENALKTFRENYTLQIALQKYHEAFKRTFF